MGFFGSDRRVSGRGQNMLKACRNNHRRERFPVLYSSTKSPRMKSDERRNRKRESSSIHHGNLRAMHCTYS
jgi:hypothetical protein